MRLIALETLPESCKMKKCYHKTVREKNICSPRKYQYCKIVSCVKLVC